MKRSVRVVALAVAGAVAAALLATRGGDAALGEGEARLTAHGAVDVSLDGGPWAPVDEPQILAIGDRVRSRTGSALIELAGGSVLELAPATTVAVDDPVAVVAGRVLAVTPDDAGVALDAGVATVAVARDGAVRIERELGATFGAYRGSAALESAGRRLQIPALHEAGVAARGLVPGTSVPLRVDPADAWDRRYLGAAIDIGRQLDAQSAGVTAQFPDAEATLLGRLVPAVATLAGPAADPAAERPVGERLVGALVALHGSGEPLEARWDRTFAFRSAGASWGLVAADQGATDAARLAGAFAAAMANAPLQFAGPQPGASDGQASGGGSAAPSGGQPPDPAPAPAPPPPAPPGAPSPPGETLPVPPAPIPPITVPPITVPESPDLPLLDLPVIEDPALVRSLLDALL